VTARAVGILRAVDLEIHRETDGEHSLDEVLRHLVAAGKKVDLAGLRKAVQAAMGSPAKSLGDVPSGS
jgi:predicted metalloprotease with PDZ domain